MVKPLKKSAHITKILDEKVARIWLPFYCVLHTTYVKDLLKLIFILSSQAISQKRPWKSRWQRRGLLK